MELHFSCINNDFNKNNTTHKCSECWGHIQIGHGKDTFTREALITFLLTHFIYREHLEIKLLSTVAR